MRVRERRARRQVVAAAAAVVAVASAAAAGVHPAQAASDAVAAAEALFQAGKRLLEDNRVAEACPKLAESFRLDPATGTLLALAMCHEREGKLASAWVEYSDVAARARREGRADREEAARQWMDALAPKLSTLTIAVPPAVAATPGLDVRRDGAVVGRGAWSTAVPVDPGEHVVEAAAPGKRPFTAVVRLGHEGDRRTVAVPPLEPEPARAAPRLAREGEGEGEGERESEGGAGAGAGAPPTLWQKVRLSWRRQLGLGLVGAAVLPIVAGTYFGVVALRKNEQSNAAGCIDDACDPEGKALRLEARRAGNISTISFIAAGALLAGGLVLFLGGGGGAAPADAPAARRAQVGVATDGAGALGVSVHGTF